MNQEKISIYRLMTKYCFFIGTGLFIVSISISFILQQKKQLATKQDDTNIVYGSVSEGPVPCAWEAQTPERVMSENKSQAVVVKISSFEDTNCEAVMSLRAPGFDMSPSKEEQKISLQANTKGSLSWILTPRKPGTFEIAVSDLTNTKIYGVTVTNIFGLDAIQAKIISILSGLFGPMLTVPWWWEKLRQRKNRTFTPDIINR